MILLENDIAEETLSKIVRIGGYLILGGALVGFNVGIYALFDRTLFSLLINISQHEATVFFLSVFMPSFVVIVALGYVFATTSRLKNVNLWNVTVLCILSILCLSLSVLSVFNLLSFIGGLLVLMAVIRAYTKPTFKALSGKEACFFVEVGTMLVASFSTLFLLMGFVSMLFQTYSTGMYGVSYSDLHPFMIVGTLSFLMFFTTLSLCSRGANTWLCGTLGFIVCIVSLLVVTRNQYYFFNASVYAGVSMMVGGIILQLAGAATYIRLFFSESGPPAMLTPSFLYRGSYCPFCGERRDTMVQTSCSSCKRSLMWRPEAPFCPSCGRLVAKDILICPHCHEDLWRRLVVFSVKDLEQQAITRELTVRSKRKQTWIVKATSKALRGVEEGLSGVKRLVNIVLKRLDLTLKELVYVGILTYLFTFMSFIGYVRTEPAKMAGWYVLRYGFPLQWLEVEAAVPAPLIATKARILWLMLGLDIILYFLLSLVLVCGAQKLRR